MPTPTVIGVIKTCWPARSLKSIWLHFIADALCSSCLLLSAVLSTVQHLTCIVVHLTFLFWSSSTSAALSGVAVDVWTKSKIFCSLARSVFQVSCLIAQCWVAKWGSRSVRSRILAVAFQLASTHGRFKAVLWHWAAFSL